MVYFDRPPFWQGLKITPKRFIFSFLFHCHLTCGILQHRLTLFIRRYYEYWVTIVYPFFNNNSFNRKSIGNCRNFTAAWCKYVLAIGLPTSMFNIMCWNLREAKSQEQSWWSRNNVVSLNLIWILISWKVLYYVGVES